MLQAQLSNRYKKLDEVNWNKWKQLLKGNLVAIKYQGRLQIDIFPIFDKM